MLLDMHGPKSRGDCGEEIENSPLASPRDGLTLKPVRCPACQAVAHEFDAACAQCGFSLDSANSVLGMPPTLDGEVADPGKRLGRGTTRKAEKAVRLFQQRFPQVRMTVAAVMVPETVPLPVYAFWLFNRSGVSSTMERAGANRRVLLMLDLRLKRIAAMIGYGLEPLVSEKRLRVCVEAAEGSVTSGDHGRAVEVFTRELTRQFTEVVEMLPRTYGVVSKQAWMDATADSDDGTLTPGGESQY